MTILPSYRFIFLLSSLLVLTTCENKQTSPPPKDLISEETFIPLLAEFQLMQSALNLYNDTMMVIRMRDSVLTHYRVTLEQFYASEEYYHTDIIHYQKLLNKALDTINEEQNKLLQVPNSKANSDTKIKKN